MVAAYCGRGVLWSGRAQLTPNFDSPINLTDQLIECGRGVLWSRRPVVAAYCGRGVLIPVEAQAA